MATMEKLEKNRAKLTMTVSPEAFAAATQQAYIKGVKHYNVPGFRKGKAPRKVIENLYGPEVFFEDAFEIVWGDVYDAAVAEHDLIVVDKPSLDIEKISVADGVVFTAEVQLKPEVTLGAYKGIEVEEPTYTVEDSAVDSELDREREKNARFVDVDRAAENGDRVVLDYSGSVDGKKFDGGTAEDQTLLLGSGAFIPGFEEQLVGMKAGEAKDITVTFPAEYTPELASKEAVFAVTIKAVQLKELPALDDEFAKDISEFDTLEAWKADKKKSLTERAEASKKSELENRTLKIVSDNASVEIPDVMIERQVNYMLQEMAYRLQMSGLSLEDYCKYTGMDGAKLKESYREEAASRVKLQLVLEAVGKAENVACTDEDLEKAIADYAKNSGASIEDFKKSMTDDDKAYFTDRVVAEKTVDLLVGGAKLVKEKAEKKEKAPKAEKAEKAEKKAPAKKKKAEEPKAE